MAQELVQATKSPSTSLAPGQDRKMSRKAFAVIIKPLCDIYGEPKNWDAKIGIYFDALCDVPDGLLDVAVKHCIRNSEFFPKPAELRGAIRGELEDLYRREHEARQAARALPAPRYNPPTPEERAYVQALVAKATADLGRGSLKEPSDLE